MAELVANEGLHKRYREGERDRVVLAGVDFAMADGEFVAVLGRSGSGKSTLLNLLAGIDAPDAGTVRIAGADLTALDERSRTEFRRRHVGIVFQFFHLIPTLTVEENVLLPLDLDGRAGTAARTRAMALLDSVGLADRAGSFPDVLSGGEQQRVCLARALAPEPRLVLADEPTGNLDAESGAVVLELLESLCRDGNHAVLMATHSRQAAARADRMLQIEDGRLAAVPELA